MKETKFDYMQFSEGYGLMVSKKKYSKDEALQIGSDEYDVDIKELTIGEEYIRHTINGSYEFDFKPCYITCDKHDRGAFLCWRITY